MQIFSPLHHISYGSINKLAVKRDDMIDPYVSGNKWRKLKYLIADLRNKQKNHIVTFGGAYSNHLVATAAAAAKHQLKATAFVRGECVENEMLLLCKLYGMQLIFVDRIKYQSKKELYDDYFKNDDQTYFIDEGGASVEATLGCAEIIDELEETYDHIFCAAGTGTTAAGLLNGIQKKQLSSTLHVIPVLKGGEFIRNEINKYVCNLDNLQLHTNYHFGGYAKTTPSLISFVKHFTANTGLLIDPVYTGKMFFAINDLIVSKQINPKAKILAIHTGGLLGLLGMKTKFTS